MNGTWKTTGGGGGTAVRLAAAAAVAAAVASAVVSVLAALLWVIVITAAVLLALAVVGVVLIRRRYSAHSPELARQAAALRVAAAQAVEAKPVTVIHYHGGTHVHLKAGADPAALRPLLRTEVRDYPPVDP